MVELDGEGKLCVALELGSAVVDGGEEGDAECWSEEETAGGLLFIRSSCDSPMNDNPGPCITWFPTTGSRTAKSTVPVVVYKLGSSIILLIHTVEIVVIEGNSRSHSSSAKLHHISSTMNEMIWICATATRSESNEFSQKIGAYHSCLHHHHHHRHHQYGNVYGVPFWHRHLWPAISKSNEKECGKTESTIVQ